MLILPLSPLTLPLLLLPFDMHFSPVTNWNSFTMTIFKELCPYPFFPKLTNDDGKFAKIILETCVYSTRKGKSANPFFQFYARANSVFDNDCESSLRTKVWGCMGRSELNLEYLFIIISLYLKI